MSQQMVREGFFDHVRKVVIRITFRHWSLERQPLGIDRGAKMVIEFIGQMQRDGDPLTGEKWPYSKIPDDLTVKRRFNEAASVKFYKPLGQEPPLECLGRHKFMGEMESQYRPRIAT